MNNITLSTWLGWLGAVTLGVATGTAAAIAYAHATFESKDSAEKVRNIDRGHIDKRLEIMDKRTEAMDRKLDDILERI